MTSSAQPPWDERWRAARAYQPFFCEENVLRLLTDGALPDDAAAVFVTNRDRTVAMWGQRAAAGAEPVLWDYHVVAVVPHAGVVVDLDDRQRVAWPVAAWLTHAFRTPRAAWQPAFRVVARARLLATFSSDRSHMLTADGTPRAPLPSWPAPFRPELGMTLPRFLDLDDPLAGPVLDGAGLVRNTT